MGKAARLKQQRKARVAILQKRGTITPIDIEKVKSGPMGAAYWVTGYFWEHDVKIVEPFCVVNKFGNLNITSLGIGDMEFYEARKLLKSPNNILIFEDRVAALDACQALHNEKELLDGMFEFMSKEDFEQFANDRVGNENE
ncbi:deoxy nucleotide monophosphate kinase [Acinetobacter phage vB_AbaM_CP14]|nr:deoxy nucleotide monophosphate kinase [Acinetobacter phage vB_AbaM_CP14]